MTTHTRLAEERLIKAAVDWAAGSSAELSADLAQSVLAYKASLPPVKARRGHVNVQVDSRDPVHYETVPAIELTDPVLERLGETAGVSRDDVVEELRKLLAGSGAISLSTDAIMQLIADAMPGVEE